MAIDVGLKGGIITGGLGRPACHGIILNLPFRLACFRVRPHSSGLGGAIPLEPGEIHDFYQPVQDLPDGLVHDKPVDPRVWGKKPVKITIESKFFKNEKEFLVPMEKARFAISVINFINKTTTQMKVAVTNMKQFASKAKVTIKNLKWKRRK